MSLKNPVTPPGIDPGTVRLIAQRLNHYATTGRTEVTVQEINSATSRLASKQYLSWSVQEGFLISYVTCYWQRDAFPG